MCALDWFLPTTWNKRFIDRRYYISQSCFKQNCDVSLVNTLKIIQKHKQNLSSLYYFQMWETRANFCLSLSLANSMFKSTRDCTPELLLSWEHNFIEETESKHFAGTSAN